MYKFHKDHGLLKDDEQIVQIVKSHCSEKERVRLGKLLAASLNLAEARKDLETVSDWDISCKVPKEIVKSIKTIEDGFGNVWAKKCPECGKNKMVVVRPGKAQCDNCG
jgi:hypothetical protein